MEKERIKDYIIVFLILLIIFFIIYSLLTSNEKNERKSFLGGLTTLQSEISKYIGKIQSDTFDVYNVEEILLGKTSDKKIVDNFNKELLPLVDENKIAIGNNEYYKINNTNIKKSLNIEALAIDNIEWYVSKEGIVKVDYLKKPSWWNSEFSIFYIK